MKLIKKLLVVTLMVSILAPTAAVITKKPHSDVILLSENGSETSGGYEDHELKTEHPNSFHPLKSA